MVQYVILGIVQGLTEFLPVSSSGHLVILQKIFGLSNDTMALTVVLHIGTVLSLFVFFFKDIIAAFRNRQTLLFIFLVTAATGLIGIAGKKFFEQLFSSVGFVGIALLVTGSVLLLTRRAGGRREKTDVGDALALGVMQGVAILPGISRSGMTISTLLFRKFDPQSAFRLSFLAAIPAIFGAALLEAKNIEISLRANLGNYAVGFIASFLTGLFALWALRLILRNMKFYLFGYYCIVIGIITLVFLR